MAVCSSCGLRNEADAVFCARCNHFLEWEEAPQPEAIVPAPAPVEEPAPAPTVEPGATPVAQVLDSIDESARLAREQNRPDLVQHLQQARGRLRRGAATVAVVGEFKQGKSTLVNALLQTAVCPVDADVVTAVPTVVGHGEQAGVTAYVEPAGHGPVRPVEATLNELRELVASRPGETGQRYVEVRLPHRMLRAGLRLIDTPGVGGLDSAYAQLALAALKTADGALFVSDSSQELTAPELEFLRLALERCPTLALVTTKIDLYPEWRRIVELNRRHLRAAGIDVPVLPVSSFLRLRATTDPALNEEAAFGPLVSFLAAVVKSQAGRAAAEAAAEVDFVAEHLAVATRAERAVLAVPVRSQEVIEVLGADRDRAAGLAAASAGWKVALADGVQDLIADVDHDLQQRLRTVLREAEGVIDAGDPQEAWPDTEVWLRRQVARAAVQGRELLELRARELAQDVAEDFELTGEAFALRLRDLSDVTETASLPDATEISLRPSKLQSIMMVSRTTTFGPMLIMGVAGLFGLAVPLVGVAAVAVGAGLGRRALREENQRVLAGRRQQAKAAARKYVEEVSFVLSKESRDSLRGTQRQLRDDFQARAELLEASVAAALRAAQRASALAPEARESRARELALQTDRLTQLSGRSTGHGAG